MKSQKSFGRNLGERITLVSPLQILGGRVPPSPGVYASAVLLSMDNFRALFVSPILSNVFDYCILDRFKTFLRADDNNENRSSSNVQFTNNHVFVRL